MFRRFTPDPDHANLSSEETEIEGSASPRRRPLTRSSVKPRLLFPTEKQRRERELAEEEALTEIEDAHRVEKKEKKPITPVKESFAAPATPPTTGHATRSATKQAAIYNGGTHFGPSAPELVIEDLPSSTERRPRKKTSPFDVWQRTKAVSSAGHGKGKKRGAEQMEGVGGTEAGSKRTKANSAP